MSISFSGLNSGIDTSSWVESLVALKNAKVTKLETEKESVVLSQETLNNIKSFFSSFRSLIEKVTDTKFNIASMDLFAQNLANSSNVSKVTASATTDAVEASYEINVDKLATNTKATSGVSYTTTIVTTTTATNNTYLTDLAGGGIKAGDIQVTNSLGATNTISITSKDTIGSLVEKFQGVGVDAYYSDTTGVFSLNIDTNNINDIGNTGIKDALHLSNVNSGYQSGTLNETNTETTWDNADSTTKLSAFGAKSGTMTIQSNGYEYSVTINDNTTIADFVQKLKNLGIDASYNDGELEINDIEISDEGTTNIINALGIEKESVSNTSISDNLNYQEEKIATIDDKISDFVSNSSGIVSICSANGEEIGQISVSESTTFGNLFEKLADYGISAYMDDGVISFAETNGNYLTGNLITALGIEVGTTAASTTSGLGVASNSTVTFQSVYSSNTTDYTTTVTTNTVTSTVGVAVSSGSQQTYNSVVTSETTDYTTTVTTNTVTSTVGVAVSSGTQQTYNSVVTSETTDYTTTVTTNTVTSTVGIAVSSSSQISYTTVGTDTTVTGTTTNVETVVTDTTKGVGLTSATTINYSTVVYTPTTTDVTQVSTQLVTTTTPTLATYTIVNTETVVNANTVQFATVSAEATVKSVSGGITTYVTQTITYDTATTTPISSDFIGSVDRIDVTGLTKLSYVSNVTKGTYLISSTADLAAINNLTSTENIVLVQGRDIDMTDSTVRVTVTFAGTYDGNGYDIVNYTDTKGFGLFETLDGATIKNLGLRDFNITTGNGSYRTGALASSVYSADIENCYIKGLTVTNAENVAVNVNQSTVGGLVGYAMTINISKSYAEDVSISTTVVKNDANDKNYNIYVGGLVGNIASKGDISDCYAKNLSITTYQSDKLEDSSSKTGFTRIGGIAGFVQTTSISRTFAENVEIKNNVDTTLGSVGATAGGILGSAYGGGNITDCYVNNISIMAETTKSAIGVGGIAGDKYSGDISNCAVLNSSISYKCSADANYQTSSTLIFSVGGIVGHTSINNLINCYVQDTELNVSSTTSMPGKSGLGGLVGWWGEGNRSVIACYTSDVTMNANNSSSITTFAGGLVGVLTNATGFKDSYVNGGSINIESSGTSYVGGLFGNAESPTVANCQVANLETSSATYKGLLAGIAYSMTVSDFSYVSSGNVSDKKMNGYYSSKTYNGATILENTTFAPDYTYDYETDYASYSNKSVVNTPYGVDGWINTINRRYSYSTVVYSTTTTTTTSTETQLENVVTTQTVKTTQTVQVTTTVPVTQTVSMTRDTTFYQLGLRGDSPQAFIGVYDGNTFTVGVNVTDSVDDIIEELSNYGINTSVRGGKFYISSSGSGYLTDIQDGICTILSLDEENNPLYTVQTSTTYVTTTVPTTETIAGATTTVLMNGSSTMAQLGLDNSTPQYIQGVANGRAFTIAIDTTDTVDEIINALEDVGLPASVRSGKIYIANSDTSYITGMSDGVKNALGFGVDAGNNTTYSTITSTTYDTTVTGSTRAVYTTVTETMTGASTMAQLGLASSNNQYIKGVANGREFTITVDTTDTVDELIDALEDVGLPASVRSGKLYIANSDTSYITGISDGVKNALGINVNAGEDTTYSTVTNMTYDTTVTSSTRVVYTTVTETMTGASTMGQLGLENSDNQYIKGVANGREFSLVISTTDKIDEIIDALGDVGIPASVRSGKLYIANSDTSYITGMSEGVQNALGISGTLGENKTYSIVNNNTYETTITGSTRVVYTTVTETMTGDTTLAQLGLSDNNQTITGVSNGNRFILTISPNETVSDVVEGLKDYGISASIRSGKLYIIPSETAYVESMSSSLENALGISSDSNFTTVSTDETYHNNNISGIALQTITVTNTLTKDTKLADLGVTSGEYCVYNNGVKYTGVLSSEDTVEDFLDTIKQFGLNGRIISDGDESKLYLVGNGDTYLTTSGFNSSNISTQLFGTDNSQNVKKENYSATLQTSSTQTSTTKADETTLLSTYDKPWGNSTLTSEGSVVFNLDGVQKVIQVSEDETIGSLLEKFRDNGVQASITDGQILLEGGFSSFSIDTSASTSNVINNLGLAYKDNLGGYSSSSSVCEQTITTVKEEMLSVAANADLSTTLDTLNITSGSLSIYRNGSKAIINIDENQTFSDLKSKLSQTFGSVDLTIEDGYLKIYDKDGAALEIGSNTDTSNFSSVLGLTKSDASTLATTRRIYQVNDSTKLTSNGVFRNGTITAGTFTIGDETLTITDDTTIRDLVSMINSSENTAATAYWDSINGQLVLTSRNTGASYINIESGTSNLTDILGFTDSSAGTKKINTSNQTLGDNAKFSINGTNYTSNSNKITSDISRIKGVTLNLNDITEGESVTISVERDTETLANTMSEIVTAYNELITKVDTEISSTGALSDQSMLKLLRNRLKSLMTSSESGSLVFKNLDAIGICSSQATASSISTDGTYTLTFDKDKFLEAYSTDRDSLKTLLLGGDSNTGVFTKIEELLESALEGAGGYFETANSTYTKRISALESKITKANTAVSNYQTQLEKKFQYMDMLIGNYQQQYSSFLSS